MINLRLHSALRICNRPPLFSRNLQLFQNCVLKSHYFSSSFCIYKEEVEDISFTEDLKFGIGPCNVGEAVSKLLLYLLPDLRRVMVLIDP